MLCLRTEAVDDDYTSPTITNNAALINWGSSIHRYLRRNNGKTSSPSLSSGDASLTSSAFQESKPLDKRNGSQYKIQLEQDVNNLQQQLQKEIHLRLALSTAVEHSDSPHSDSPYQLSNDAQDLLDNIAVLEITVSKLEQQSTALQYQLSQERNERRLAAYHLTHVHCSASSNSSCSPACKTEQIIKPCSGVEEPNTSELGSWKDVMVKLNDDYFLENLWHRPNLLSEEMVRCMRDIFLFLSDSSKLSSGRMASPCSPHGHLSYSSLMSFLDSPVLTSLGRSPVLDVDHTDFFPKDNLFDPYKVPGKVDWARSIGAYSAAVEVAWFSVGKKELEYAANALKRFRMFVEQLARVNPSCLSCNEKLAFWINLYNALIMHAYLAYGIPRSDMKLFSLMQKAAYTVGGQSLSAADIEYIILKMKPPAHRPQIALIAALQKFKISEEQKQYSIDHPEPLLSFALSCGMHSSPAVRIFKPENVNELLKRSLKDYIRASIGLSNKGKLLVPKLLHCFAKGVVEESQLSAWICQFLSPEQAAMVGDCSATHKSRVLGAKNYSVLPFDSRFRFLFLLDNKDPTSPACET